MASEKKNRKQLTEPRAWWVFVWVFALILHPQEPSTNQVYDPKGHQDHQQPRRLVHTSLVLFGDSYTKFLTDVKVNCSSRTLWSCFTTDGLTWFLFHLFPKCKMLLHVFPRFSAAGFSLSQSFEILNLQAWQSEDYVKDNELSFSKCLSDRIAPMRFDLETKSMCYLQSNFPFLVAIAWQLSGYQVRAFRTRRAIEKEYANLDLCFVRLAESVKPNLQRSKWLRVHHLDQTVRSPILWRVQKPKHGAKLDQCSSAQAPVQDLGLEGLRTQKLEVWPWAPNLQRTFEQSSGKECGVGVDGAFLRSPEWGWLWQKNLRTESFLKVRFSFCFNSLCLVYFALRAPKLWRQGVALCDLSPVLFIAQSM